MADKSPFTSIRDEAYVSKILNVAAKHKVRFTFWFKEQDFRFESELFQYLQYLRKLHVKIPDSITLEAIKNALSLQESSEIFGSFQIDTVNYFFKATVMEIAPRDYFRIEIPKEIYKVQRRANLRIPFKRNQAPKISCIHPNFYGKHTFVDEELLSFRMLDISAGGFAIAASLELGEFLPIGKILRDVRFVLKGTDIHGNAIIRHRKESKNDQGAQIIRIGLEFQNLHPQLERHIAQYVLEESRKIFSIMY